MTAGCCNSLQISATGTARRRYVKRIAVIGSLNVDYVSYVDRLPKIGETIQSEHLDIVPGGKGANQAFALGRMGAPVTMFGAVGMDANAETELESLRLAGVDLSHIARVKAPTGIAAITVIPDGDNSIIVSPGANSCVDIAYIDAKMHVLQQCDIILFQLEVPLETVVYAIEKLKGMGKVIVLDPAPAVAAFPLDLLKYVDYIKPNETELSALTGITEISGRMEEACDLLLAHGAGCVLASIGPQGVMVKKQAEASRVYGAHKVHVLDTTAAGDSFTAAVAYALANNRGIDEAVIYANEIAAYVVQRKGAQSSMPSKSEAIRIWTAVLDRSSL